MTPPLPHASLRTIAVGGTTKSELVRQLVAAGVQLNTMAVRLFDDARFTTMETPIPLRTWEISVGELGFGDGATIGEIHVRAAESGLVPGPLELAPHMRLQHLDQPGEVVGATTARHRAPSGSWTIASLPVSDDEDFPCGFYLRRIDGVPWLRGYQSWAGHRWSADDRFIFVERAGYLR